MDGLGIGLGFTFSLTVIGAVREMLGSGAIFGMKFIHGDGMLLFILAPGAFIVLATCWCCSINNGNSNRDGVFRYYHQLDLCQQYRPVTVSGHLPVSGRIG